MDSRWIHYELSMNSVWWTQYGFTVNSEWTQYVKLKRKGIPATNRIHIHSHLPSLLSLLSLQTALTSQKQIRQ